MAAARRDSFGKDAALEAPSGAQEATEETPLKLTISGVGKSGPGEMPVVCWFILAVEVCERLAFYTIAGSQAFFLEHIGFSLSSAGSLNATLWTLCTVLSVLASWTADVGLGRYATILASGMMYVLGCALASIAATPSRERVDLYFAGVLFFLPLATAGIKANISNFGADQYDTSDPAQQAAQERFFSIFYCSINAGAALSYGFFTTFATGGGLGVPKEWGYATAYGIMALSMLAAVGIYRAGRPQYKVQPLLQKSALASLFSCLRDAATEGRSGQAAVVLMGLMLLCVSIALSTISAIASGSQSLMLAAFLSAAAGTLAVVVPCLSPHWLRSRPQVLSADEHDVQGFLSLLPALFTGNLSINAVYNCMQFWYQQQACQMDVRMGSGDFQLSGSFFNIADCLAIIVVTPIALSYIDPRLERFVSAGHSSVSAAKFTLGIAIACASVFFAARLEQWRRMAPVLESPSNCAPPGVHMSAVSASWMMVPYFLMGVAEIYTQPVLMHLAYSRSPASMRTLAMAASFFISAVSAALFSLLTSALSAYMPNDLNAGHLEYGYYINIGVGLFFLACFLNVLRRDDRQHLL